MLNVRGGSEFFRSWDLPGAVPGLDSASMSSFRLAVFSLLAAAVCAPVEAKFPDNFDEALEVVAFGSCNRDELPQPLWEPIAAQDPDLFIWAGDNIYADWYAPPDGEKVDYQVDEAWIWTRYQAQRARPDYKAFRERFSILSIWDDHDYGRNNAGADFKLKEVSRDLALRFAEVPESDPRWEREGLYGAYDFGPAGRRVKVVLLDNRYFATGKRAERPELLGAAQREWLERSLRESRADIHLLVSGIQVLSAEHKWEKWADYPETRQWLIDLIAEDGMPMTVLLSGDRHIHEISVLEDPRLDYPLVDITSSGLTHYWEGFPGEENRLRRGEVYAGLGYGLLRIDWSEERPRVTVEIRDDERAVESYTVAVGDADGAAAR